MVDFKSTLSASGMDPQAGYTGQLQDVGLREGQKR